jgi:hypothetical protein
VANNPNPYTEVAVGAAGNAAGTFVGGTAVAFGLSPEVSAALSVFAGAIPSLIRAGFQSRAQRRCAIAAAAMAREAAAAPAVNMPETPASQEVFLSMFYDLMDAVDDAAAGPLGHLASSYARLELPPDPFFRAFGRVVRELDGVELSDLRTLLSDCVLKVNEGKSAFADSSVVRTNYRDPVGHTIESWKGSSDGWVPAVEVQNGVRLLLLMKQHGLAAEPTDVPGIIGGEPVMARIWRGIAGRALMHLDGGSCADGSNAAPAPSKSP